MGRQIFKSCVSKDWSLLLSFYSQMVLGCLKGKRLHLWAKRGKPRGTQDICGPATAHFIDGLSTRQMSLLVATLHLQSVTRPSLGRSRKSGFAFCYPELGARWLLVWGGPHRHRLPEYFHSHDLDFLHQGLKGGGRSLLYSWRKGPEQLTKRPRASELEAYSPASFGLDYKPLKG